MTSYKDLISIILPVYNGEKYLPEAIKSFLIQSYNNFELIIVNDCSTDKSLQIANSYAKKDSRIKIINNKENKKLPASLNIGHQYAKGKYITWTSDDNIAKPIFLEELITVIKAQKTDLAFSNYDIINEDGSFRREHICGPLVNLIFGNVFGASFMYKKEVFDELGGFNESLFLVEDYDFWLRASLKFSITHLDANLYQYRIHSTSLTNDIQKNIKVNKKYRNGIRKMYSQIATILQWNSTTEKLVASLHLRDEVLLRNYLKSKKHLIKDLELYQQKIKSTVSIKKQLWYLLRDQWKTVKENQRFNILIKVLIRQPQLLFFNEYSTKQTLALIAKCFKKV